MKKKKLLIGALSISMALGIGAVALTIGKQNFEPFELSADETFVLTIDTPLWSGEGSSHDQVIGCQTELGNPVNFTHDKLYAHPGDGTVHDDHLTAVNGIENGGYIAVTGNSKGQGIAGIKSFSVKANCKDYYNYTMTAQYGWEDGVYVDATEIHTDNVQDEYETLDFNYDYPSFIKVTFNKTSGADIMIDEIKITYTCKETENPYYVSGDWVGKYSTDDSGYLITKYNGTSTDLSFPSTMNGRPVVGIDHYLKYTNITSSDITSVTIPEGYRMIGHEAFATQYGSYQFHYAENLTSVILPSTLIMIGDSAFYRAGLTSITIPKSVTHIGQYAFRDTSACLSLTFEMGGTEDLMIYSSAFESNRHTGDLVLPKRLVGDETNLGNYVFDAMPNVTAFKIEDDYDSGAIRCYNGALFEASVLYNYPVSSSLTEYTIPTWCTSIREYEGFNSAKYLEVVNFTNTSSKEFDCGDFCFSGCANLREINFSTGNTHVYWFAFRGCSKLTNLVIPENVKIGEKGLYDMGGTTEDPIVIFSEAAAQPANWNVDWDGGEVADGKLNIYYYSESEAAGYWHYVAGVPTLW